MTAFAACSSDSVDGEGLAVIFVDLDKFKAINDTLGHVAGDDVLGIVAERLRRAVRATDVVWGGSAATSS